MYKFDEGIGLQTVFNETTVGKQNPLAAQGGPSRASCGCDKGGGVSRGRSQSFWAGPLDWPDGRPVVPTAAPPMVTSSPQILER